MYRSLSMFTKRLLVTFALSCSIFQTSLEASSHSGSSHQRTRSLRDLVKQIKSIVNETETTVNNINTTTQNMNNTVNTINTTTQNINNTVNTINTTTANIETIVTDIDARLQCENYISICSSDIGTTGYVIATPGVYCICEDVTFNPATANLSIITIASNDVVLNINQNTLSQTGLPAIGISANGVNNILIYNGFVESMKEGAFDIKGCHNIQINNVGVQNNVTGLYIFNSLDVSLDAVRAIGNEEYGAYMTETSRVKITNSNFDDSFGPDLVTGLTITIDAPNTTSSDYFISNCTFNGNQTLGYYGYAPGFAEGLLIYPFSSTGTLSNINISDCQANNNSGFEGEGIGFNIWFAENITLSNCIAQNNLCLGGPSGRPGENAGVGFSFYTIESGSIDNCVAQGNGGNADFAGGFRARLSVDMAFRNCIATDNVNDSTGTAYGFYTNSDEDSGFLASNHLYENCIATDTANTGPGQSGGFELSSLDESTIRNCQSISNGSFGFNTEDTTGLLTHNFFKGNTAMNHSNYGFADYVGYPKPNQNFYSANYAYRNVNNFAIPDFNPIRGWQQDRLMLTNLDS